MSKYFSGNETRRINFPDGQWVDVKEELTQEDSDYILSQLAKTSITEGKKTPDIEISLGKLALLERSIVAWSFADDSGQPVPVTRDNISRLRRRYRSVILPEVDKLNQEADSFSKN